MTRLLSLICFLLLSVIVQAQPIIPTPGDLRLATKEQRDQLIKTSWVQHIPFVNAGPSIFSGRVVDLSVNPLNPHEFLVAYASGGLWRTTNNGSSFTPLFDKETVITIGAIAADWATGTIWVGTGEVNSSRSSYAGVGVYVSEDNGATWQYRGLPESHHIGRIILHPEDSRIAWVAVLGHLYSEQPERGVYKTTDSGLTWEQSLSINQRTGAVDLVIDPHYPDVLYAAMWERDRSAWNLTESGTSSGIYQTSNGGATWELISTAERGFPQGDGIGRIGLAIGYRGDSREVCAILDNQTRRPISEKERVKDVLSKDVLRKMTKETFIALTEKKIQTYLDEFEFPKAYTAARVKEMILSDSILPLALVEYVEEANSLLFDTPVIGAEVYTLTADQPTWKKTHDNFLDDIFYSYGYYFGQIRVEQNNPDNMYIMGVPVLHSTDGGKSFTSVNGENVHGDHHALWINPKQPNHLILGNDGGLNISEDAGETWIRANRPPVGQFYSVAVDEAEPFNIYGGLQDNGVWKGPSDYTESVRWEMSGQYPYKSILGGDGMQIAIDPRNEFQTVYTGFQFGNYFRVNTQTGKQEFITPKHELGERPYRWNWQTPIHLSRHNPDVLYMGSQKFLRSLDRGDHFDVLSGDLTQGGIKGDVPYGTLTTIDESPLKFGLLYCGSDDGLVHISRDGGYSWQRITNGLPTDMWVSRIQASQFQEGRVYISLNGYRWDHFDAYVYRSEDYGQTWIRIAKDLPKEPVNVICEDPVNADLLYIGTDHGAYIALDGGNRVMPFDRDLPRVPIHDLVVQKQTNTLVLGTHGRSFFTADVKHVQELTPKLTEQELTVFSPEPIQYQKNWGKRWNSWQDPNIPSLPVWTYSQVSRKVTWSVYPENDKKILLATGQVDIGVGLSSWDFDLAISNEKGLKKWIQADRKDTDNAIDPAENGIYYLTPGTYRIELESDQIKTETTFKVVEKKRR